MKDILHFSHANGFPANTYEIMLGELEPHFQIGTINTLAHNSDFPVNNNWSNLLDELELYMQSQYKQPVIAVGHSFGGVLSYMLACKRPDLIKQLIILDAPVLDPVASVFVRVAKKLSLMDKITPAGRTNGRQETWTDFSTAVEYFKGKRLFKHVDERCLNHYVEHGLQAHPEGLGLVFQANTEVSIYRTIPDNLYKYPKANIPLSMIHGDKSDVVYKMQLNYMRNKLGFHTQEVKGGHLFPLEQPEMAARIILETIRQHA